MECIEKWLKRVNRSVNCISFSSFLFWSFFSFWLFWLLQTLSISISSVWKPILTSGLDVAFALLLLVWSCTHLLFYQKKKSLKRKHKQKWKRKRRKKQKSNSIANQTNKNASWSAVWQSKLEVWMQNRWRMTSTCSFKSHCRKRQTKE